jgi:hypothetical protein
MFTEKFLEVIGKEGVVSIVSYDGNGAHVANTWNSYLVARDNVRLLIPAHAMRETEKKTSANNKVSSRSDRRKLRGFAVPGRVSCWKGRPSSFHPVRTMTR